MFAMSFTALTLVIWRIFLNRTANTNLNVFLEDFQEKTGERRRRRRLELLPHAIRHDPAQAVRCRLGDLAARAVGHAPGHGQRHRAGDLPELNFLLPTILAIAKIATMVGLLGTVISMIGTFSEIQELRNKGGDITSQSGAIGLALSPPPWAW